MLFFNIHSISQSAHAWLLIAFLCSWVSRGCVAGEVDHYKAHSLMCFSCKPANESIKKLGPSIAWWLSCRVGGFFLFGLFFFLLLPTPSPLFLPFHISTPFFLSSSFFLGLYGSSGSKSNLAWSWCLYLGCSTPLRMCFLVVLHSCLQEFFLQRDTVLIFLAGHCYYSSRGLWVLTKK